MNQPIKSSYHHGDLRQAMLAEAERVLEAEGIQGISLRGMARAVGVSHAAPANHFGDLTGLLSELAADGHRRFGAALAIAMQEAGADFRARSRAMARAYVRFANEHPGLFTLMFRDERLNAQRPALNSAIITGRQRLKDAVMEIPGNENKTPLELTAEATARWSLVHGFSVLMIEGRLRRTLAELAEPITEEELFEAVLDIVNFENDPALEKARNPD